MRGTPGSQHLSGGVRIPASSGHWRQRFSRQNALWHNRIVFPGRPKKNATAYEERKVKARFRRRAAMQPRIGHLKSDFRLGGNFLNGQVGDAINLLLAAVSSNLRRWIREVLFGLVTSIQNWAQECRAFRLSLRRESFSGPTS